MNIILFRFEISILERWKIRLENFKFATDIKSFRPVRGSRRFRRYLRSSKASQEEVVRRVMFLHSH